MSSRGPENQIPLPGLSRNSGEVPDLGEGKLPEKGGCGGSGGKFLLFGYINYVYS